MSGEKNLLDQINLEQACTAFKRISDLEPNTEYEIYQLNKTTTKFGDALQATVKLEDQLVRVFISQKYLTYFTTELIRKVNANEMKFVLKYDGQCSTYSRKAMYSIKEKTAEHASRKRGRDDEDNVATTSKI